MPSKELLEQTATGWLLDLQSRSPDKVVSKWTEDIHYAVHPDPDKRYPMTREQFRTSPRTAAIFQHLKSFTITVDDIFTDVEKRTVVLNCLSNGQTEKGSYVTECLFVLTMTEDGSKIMKLDEWINMNH